MVAFIGMWWLGDWQFRRAIAGNGLSWAYTFEWPIFAIFGAVFWVKTVRDELHPARPRRARRSCCRPGRRPADAGTRSEPVLAVPGCEARLPTDDGEADPELDEYNAYLAMLNKEVKRHGKWHGLR